MEPLYSRKHIVFSHWVGVASSLEPSQKPEREANLLENLLSHGAKLIVRYIV